MKLFCRYSVLLVLLSNKTSVAAQQMKPDEWTVCTGHL